MAPKASPQANGYRCAIERNQNGKYSVRIRALFGRHDWALPLYFLASSFDRAMEKLEQSLQLLQRSEEKLFFWGVERSDDPNLTGEMLEEFGLRLDQRAEFPRKAATLLVPRERAVPASQFAPMRRTLAESVVNGRAAAASD